VTPVPLTVGATLSATDGTSGKTLAIDTLDADCANGIPVNVRVANGLAYLSCYWDGLRIVDVHDPAHPAELGHLLAEYPDQGEIYNNVVDATTPSAPAIVAHFGTPPGQNQPINVHTIFLDGGKAYLSGARAYVNWWAAGIEILDVSNPASIQKGGTFAGFGQKTSRSSWGTQVDGRTIAIHGDEQWDSHVHVVDVTEGAPTFATAIGEWKTRPQVSAHNIMAFGSRVYMTYYQDGMRVLDLSDPTRPVPVAWFDTWPGYSPDYGTSFFEGAVGLDVDLANQLVYVADTRRGLIVLHLDV